MASNHRGYDEREQIGVKMFKNYFYSRETLELMAEDINRRYYPERLENVLPLDPYDLLEKQGLDVERKYISPNEQLLGLIFFADEKFPVWDKGTFKKGDKPHFELFKKGTIVINNILVEKKKHKKKEMFVCTHENCHWIKDLEYFKDHPENIIQICDSKSLEKTYWNSKMSDRDIIERQNNYLCAAVIMPRDVIKKAFFKSMRYKNIPDKSIEYKPFMKKHIAILANMYGINYNPVLYRLFDLNILIRPDKEDNHMEH